MRNTSPFSTYNRAIAKRQPLPQDAEAPPIDKSLLGAFGALEIHLLSDLVRWAEADATHYEHQL